MTSDVDLFGIKLLALIRSSLVGRDDGVSMRIRRNYNVVEVLDVGINKVIYRKAIEASDHRAFFRRLLATKDDVGDRGVMAAAIAAECNVIIRIECIADYSIAIYSA